MTISVNDNVRAIVSQPIAFDQEILLRKRSRAGGLERALAFAEAMARRVVESWELIYENRKLDVFS